jgi:hypothetical protein
MCECKRAKLDRIEAKVDLLIEVAFMNLNPGTDSEALTALRTRLADARTKLTAAVAGATAQPGTPAPSTTT